MHTKRPRYQRFSLNSNPTHVIVRPSRYDRLKPPILALLALTHYLSLPESQWEIMSYCSSLFRYNTTFFDNVIKAERLDFLFSACCGLSPRGLTEASVRTVRLLQLVRGQRNKSVHIVIGKQRHCLRAPLWLVLAAFARDFIV